MRFQLAHRSRVLALTLACGVGAAALAQEPGEVIVRVGEDPAEAATTPPNEPPAPPVAPTEVRPARPSYWIGILGGDVSEELRAHLGLEGAGVLVREVVPDSPADQAGIKKFDVLLSANGQPVTEMGALAQVVREVGGTDNGKITIDLLRAGGHEQLTVTPAERPAPAAPPQPVGPNGPAAPEGLGPEAVMQQFFGGADGGPFQFRMFGPGVAVGGANVDIQAPGNTSVQVQTQNGQTHVTVNQNGKTWEVDADDPEALEQLPEEVRPMVEGLINGQGVDVNVDLQDMLPQLEGMFDGFGERWAGRRDERLRRRMEALERQLDQLRSRLGEESGEAPAANDVAPAFEPPQPPAPAVEVEIPAEGASSEDVPADK
ncbi:putative serine protease HhoA precursor [Posidoniimonas polymericola]|uniref:Putative serine protease HhoA n=1 Tax=Posidoniimonas polymericola TaxID=2528002 RepID=A0A5C5ZDZ9_9BACT|nr:PDZ domain-containing protein [Posidoniimonas polymericola]TWT85395.1 putative serine protease HhoA precursor [Posidoniimonas polymericola]